MIPYIKWGNKMIYQLCVLRDLIKKSYLKFFGVSFLVLHNSVVFDWFCFWQNIILYVGTIFVVFLLYLVTFLRNI